ETGSGFCSNENKEARSKLLLYFSVRFAYAHSADMIDAFDSHHFSVVSNSDSAICQNPFQQVRRHLAKVRATNQQRYVIGGLGKKHGGLTGGVSAANHMRRGTATESRLDVGRAVIHARALQVIETFNIQHSVGHARGDDYRFS